MTLLVVDPADPVRSQVATLARMRYKRARLISARDLEAAARALAGELPDIALLDAAAAQERRPAAEPLLKQLLDGPHVLLSASHKPLSFCGEVLHKPIRAALFHSVLDKYVDLVLNTRDEQRQPAAMPGWAQFKYLDITELYQNYSTDRQKVFRMLGLYRGRVAEVMERALRHAAGVLGGDSAPLLCKDARDLLSAFAYIAPPAAVGSARLLCTQAEAGDLPSARATLEGLAAAWAGMEAEIAQL